MLKVLDPPRNRVAEEIRLATRPCTATARYAFLCGEHEMQLVPHVPSPRQADAVRHDDAEFALIVEDGVLLLGVRFVSAIPWTFATYSWHETPRPERRLPPPCEGPNESRALVQVKLLEPKSGRAIAERNLTVWLHFTRALHEAIRDQARMPFDPRSVDRAVSRIRRLYPTDDALASSARFRTIGCP